MKKIAVVTGTRADFGLLTPLLEKIVADPDTELQLIVTGMHLSPEFGMTVNEIREAGYDIADEIEILLSSDTGVGTAKSVGLATIGFAETLGRHKPDWLVLLGDRFEILAAATAATLIGIPIAHIHGGERTEGAIDEAIRHSITKMAQLHFVSTPEYRKRVIQLGESPDRVFHVGAIGLDRIRSEYLLSRQEIADQLGIDANKRWCTVTFHPVTLDPASVEAGVRELIGVMKGRQDLHYVITKANADESGRKVNRLLADFAESAQNASLFDSLGSRRYLSCVKESVLVLGNSSSALIEAPQLGTPTVDIGMRQMGRARGESVVHCGEHQAEIEAAMKTALKITEPKLYESSPYYNGGAAGPIHHTLKMTPPARIKTFFDVEFDL